MKILNKTLLLNYCIIMRKMKIFKPMLILLSIVIISITSCKQSDSNSNTIQIVPKPVSLEQKSGSFTLSKTTSICYAPGLEDMAGLFVKQIEAFSGITAALSDHDIAKNSITLKISNNIEQEEGYTLDVSPSQVVITGKTSAGVFYGIQSFLQSLTSGIQTTTDITLPCFNITDYPRFKWRGMHLDESRHFFGVDVVPFFRGE